MRATRKRLVQMAIVGAVLASVAWMVTAAGATSARLSVGSAARLPLFTAVNGALPASTPLRLTISLQPRNAAELQSLATAVSTPGSSSFRHYLTVPEFASRFGATSSAVAAVTDALRADGLTVGSVSANNLMIPVTGTAAEVDTAFHASLVSVKLFQTGRTTYANLTAPTLPASIAADVQGVIGLDDLAPPQSAGATHLSELKGSQRERALVAASPHSRSHVQTGGPQPCSQATGADAYTADELAGAYGFTGLYTTGDLGQGESVAVIEIEGYNPTDVATYQACYGTSATVTPINVDGGPGTFNAATDDDGESALDIETIAGLAPKATIDVYQLGPTATTQDDAINAAVSQNTAKVISDSVGACEAQTPPSAIAAESTILQEAATQGQSFFISSGDSGAQQCSQAGTTLPNSTTPNPSFSANMSVLDPASQPFATGVGGTSLFKAATGGGLAFDTDGSPPYQTVWNDGTSGHCNCGGDQASNGDVGSGGGATGGGLSSMFAMPSYQSGAAASLDVVGTDSAGSCAGATKCREVPDVSADADDLTGYATYTNGKWGGSGGTSAAAPLWAAFASIVDADGACRGLPIGFVNPALYQIAGSAYATNFDDISTQATPWWPSQQGGPSNVTSNEMLKQFDATVTTNDANNLYQTRPGYDLATGLGSMIATPLAGSLCAVTAPTYTVSVGTPGPQTGFVGRPFSLQIGGTDSGNAALTYSATGLPAGLSISASGLISGTPTTTGPVNATITATDQYKNSGTASFIITITTPPPAAVTTPSFHSVSLAGVAQRKAKLTFTVASPAGIKTLVITAPTGLNFAKSKTAIRKGLRISNGSGVARVSGRKLTIAFNKAVASVKVTITHALLTTSKATAKKAKKKTKVKLTIKVINAGGVSGVFALKLKL